MLDSATVVAEAAKAQVGEAAEEPETPEESTYPKPVVCRATARAASRLRGRARVCDTRRTWHDFEDAAAAEASGLQNMGRNIAAHDPMRAAGTAG